LIYLNFQLVDALYDNICPMHCFKYLIIQEVIFNLIFLFRARVFMFDTWKRSITVLRRI